MLSLRFLAILAPTELNPNATMNNLPLLSIDTGFASSIAFKADDDLVTERPFIDSFVQNCDRKI